jgi:hypothetical protein
VNYAPQEMPLGDVWINTYWCAFDLLPMCGALVVSVRGYRGRKRGGHPDRKRLCGPWRLTLIQAIHAIADLFDYIEPFYNRRRRHSTSGGDSPARFLENWISAQHAQELAA